MALQLPTLYQIEKTLRAGLTASLLEPDAHLALAPRPRRGWQPGHIPEGSKRAAGLLLLYPLNDAPHILLTVRAGTLATHAGQISLPGGRIEADETIPDAALREAAEEVGLDPSWIHIVGFLSTLYIPVSNFVLHPVVAISDRRPASQSGADANEVERILEVPLYDLMNGSRLRRGSRWSSDKPYRVPYFEICEERVWGATAMVLAELLTVLGSPPNDPWNK